MNLEAANAILPTGHSTQANGTSARHASPPGRAWPKRGDWSGRSDRSYSRRPRCQKPYPASPNAGRRRATWPPTPP
jgi:hypothetical protein